MSSYLVIGASSGIGSWLSQHLATEGHTVFGTWNGHEPEETSAIRFQKFNATDDAFNTDILPDKLDGLVYCPGTISLKPFARIKPQEFADDLQVQLIGAVKVIQAVLPKLKASSSASIVLFSTVAVQNGFNFHTLVSASKGAVEGFTKALAAELAPTVRVNAIAPSITDTPLAGALLNSEEKRNGNAQRHPMKRIGSPQDIGELAAFLLSEKSSWITGQIIHSDGGMSTIR